MESIDTGVQAAAPPGAPPAPSATGNPARWVILAVTLSAIFMQMLDTTITMVALPSLQSDLGATFAEIQLVVAVYSLAFACTLVTGGRLGDIHGRKKVFLIGMLGFTIASALCGAAPDSTFLIASRILQGMCSGLMFPQVLSIIQVTFSTQERPKALAMYGASVGLGTVLGPVLGGWLIDLDIFGTDWRAIFYVNLPIGLIALCLGMAKIPESSAPGAQRLDVTGAVILTAGLFSLILPLVIGREHDWPGWSLVLLVLSPLLLAEFFVYENKLTKLVDRSPLVPTGLFRERSFTVGLIISVVFFAGIPSFFMTFFMSLQIGFNYTPISAGLVSLGFAALIAVGSARSAAVVKKLGTKTLALGTGLLLIGMAGVIGTLHWAGSDLHGYQLIPSLMVAGLGGGFFLAPCTGIILAGIRSSNAGSASGMLATVQQVGIAIGIAVAGILFYGLLGTNADDASASAVPQLRSDLAAAGVAEAQQTQISTAFTTCFHDKMNQKDLTETPASCARIQQEMANSPLPQEVKQKVKSAVLGKALPEARKANFGDSFEQVVYWQIGCFGLSCLLVLALPRIRPEDVQDVPGGA
ncbi:MFS transporter [Streptomyces cylindrosporus]|uniref:MFS transporter n=1 Tax=Streptomyces cylindrosporus TaxID=2927583 RepID=A0ABS9Y2R9_9ACTN|nr:MFS transporter [Streptomyces cylindrosporus]MCI3271304.1 MFS transporter [Streptomyces cylindrosporus]